MQEGILMKCSSTHDEGLSLCAKDTGGRIQKKIIALIGSNPYLKLLSLQFSLTYTHPVRPLPCKLARPILKGGGEVICSVGRLRQTRAAASNAGIKILLTVSLENSDF